MINAYIENLSNNRGKWFELKKYEDEDEFLSDVAKELHGDVEEDEFMVTDVEDLPSTVASGLSLSELWSLEENLREVEDSGNNTQTYIEWLDEVMGTYDESSSVDDFTDQFYGGPYESEEAFAEQLLEETGELNAIPENLRYYFDYEKYAHDLFMGDFIMTGSGYVFRM